MSCSLKIKRIYTPWESWECFKDGFYDEKNPKMTDEKCEELYLRFFRNLKEFEYTLELMCNTYKNSCKNFLTNANINRIAWLGQAAICFKYKVPSKYRYAFKFLTEEE